MYCFFEYLAKWTTHWAGSTFAFVFASSIIAVWLICGPIFSYSDTWQLCVNTGTTIITFLMVFLLQRANNRDCVAMQIKLNELLAAQKGASNKLINIEHMTEEEIDRTYKLYEKLVQLEKEESHSIEELNHR